MSHVRTLRQQSHNTIGIIGEHTTRQRHLVEEQMGKHLSCLRTGEDLRLIGVQRQGALRHTVGRCLHAHAVIGYHLLEVESKIDVLHLVGQVGDTYVEELTRIIQIHHCLRRQHWLCGRHRNQYLLSHGTADRDQHHE